MKTREQIKRLQARRKRKRLRVHDATGAPVADLWPQTVSAARRVFGRLRGLVSSGIFGFGHRFTVNTTRACN